MQGSYISSRNMEKNGYAKQFKFSETLGCGTQWKEWYLTLALKSTQSSSKRGAELTEVERGGWRRSREPGKYTSEQDKTKTLEKEFGIHQLHAWPDQMQSTSIQSRSSSHWSLCCLFYFFLKVFFPLFLQFHLKE